MKNHLINKKEWENYFDQTSKHLLGHQVELEIVGLDIGDQVEEEWVNLEGLSYDPRENILFVHTAESDHPILTPVEVIVSEEGSLIRSIVVRDSKGNLQILNFRKPFQIESGKQGIEELPVTLY